MHELSIAISMVEEVTAEVESRGGLAIEAVHLSLGSLSGVDKEALRFCYQAACEGTILDGSRLVIQIVPVTIRCPDCEHESNPESILRLTCPHCGGAAQVIRGHDIEVSALEVAA
jgi:hydrogenase nickel incorporation protein HypA/HybF